MSEAESSFVIGDVTVARGERAFVALPVSQTLSGISANLMLEVIHGAQPGKVVFVSGAIHGDEIVGTAIIQRLVAGITPDKLAGTLILAPAVNIYGLIGHSRYLPDRRDLNRSFPGSAKGSLASQLAHCFLENVIKRADLGIDLHTAAVHRYNLPQVRIAEGDAQLMELAMAFGAPVIVESPLRDGSMRALAGKLGVPMLLLEAGEALRFDRLSMDVGTQGILRVLAHVGMVDASMTISNIGTPARTRRTSWVRAPRGGVTHRHRKSGDVVRKGDVLAHVGGVFGENPLDLVSPIDGIVIGHATLPVVHQGDALFHIAAIDQLEDTSRHIDALNEATYAPDQPPDEGAMLDEDEVI